MASLVVLTANGVHFTPSIIPVKKMKSQVHALQEKPERRERLATGLSIVHHSEEQDDITVATILEYFQRLQMMANVWALVGNYDVPSMATQGHVVTMMTLNQANNYADDALQLTVKQQSSP